MISQIYVSYPPPPLSMKISYIVGLRYGFEGKKNLTKHQVCVWNERNPYLIPETRETKPPVRTLSKINKLSVRSYTISSINNFYKYKVNQILIAHSPNSAHFHGYARPNCVFVAFNSRESRKLPEVWNTGDERTSGRRRRHSFNEDKQGCCYFGEQRF